MLSTTNLSIGFSQGTVKFITQHCYFFNYVSSADENGDFCVVGAGLHRVSAVRPEDVDWEIRPKSTRSFGVYGHAERERGDCDRRGMNQSPDSNVCTPVQLHFAVILVSLLEIDERYESKAESS